MAEPGRTAPIVLARVTRCRFDLPNHLVSPGIGDLIVASSSRYLINFPPLNFALYPLSRAFPFPGFEDPFGLRNPISIQIFGDP